MVSVISPTLKVRRGAGEGSLKSQPTSTDEGCGASFTANKSSNEEKTIDSTSGENGGVIVTGTVQHFARLSSSFGFFTIQPCSIIQATVGKSNVLPTDEEELLPENGMRFDYLSEACKKKKNLDIVVRTKDGVPAHQIQSLFQKVQVCWDSGEPVEVHGWLPLERCQCKVTLGSDNTCQHYIFHAWKVNNQTEVTVDWEYENNVLDIYIPPPRKQNEPNQKCTQVNTVKGTATSRGKHEEKSNSSSAPTTIEMPIPQSDGRRQRSRLHKYSRSARFVELLVQVLGVPYLSSSQTVGVLDVAGGGTGGGVTFELTARRGIRTCVIDPRELKLDAKQKRTLKFRTAGRQKIEAAQDISHLAKALMKRYQEFQPVQLRSMFLESFAEDHGQEGERLLRECTAIVGMHPDSATEAIVNLAIAYNKPFMVCPCCVFPNLFTERRLLPTPPKLQNEEGAQEDNDDNSRSGLRQQQEGRMVRTYEDLCQYIRERVDNVQESVLDFEGRNRVLYWIPPSLNKEIPSS